MDGLKYREFRIFTTLLHRPWASPWHPRRAVDSDVLSPLDEETRAYWDRCRRIDTLLKRQLADYYGNIEAWIALQRPRPDKRLLIFDRDTVVRLQTLLPLSDLLVEYILKMPIAAVEEPGSRDVFEQCLSRMPLRSPVLRTLHHSART